MYIIYVATCTYVHSYFLITDTSVFDATVVLSSPNLSSRLQSITVTCAIHPNSTADQCAVMAMDDDGRVTITGKTPY